MPEMERFDAIVIGAGQGGDPLARAWATAGKRVALIERKYVGGSCVNVGCTPTKAMLASARTAHLVRQASAFGVHTDGGVTVSMREVRGRAQAIVQDFRQGTERKLQKKGVELVYGAARFTEAKTLTVTLNNNGGERQMTADQIFIDVGTRPAIPDIPGLADTPFLDNGRIEQLESIPEHLVILGGSYIAVEFGQMFRRFGSQVTIIERAPRLMSREDDDISDAMTQILREDGIVVHTDAEATQVTHDQGVTVTFRTGGGAETSVTGTHLLVATGRKPNTDDLGLDAAGVETDEHKFVKTNSALETNVSGVYALGDCKGGPEFTHISYDDFRVLCARLLDGKTDITIQGRPVPYTVFTDPQLGRIGMTETEARKTGRKIAVAKLPMTEVARAIETSETRGLMKAVVDNDTEEILGCAILGPEGGEVMTVVEVAMMGGLPYTALRDGVFAHPTLSESLNNLFMALDPIPSAPTSAQTAKPIGNNYA